MRAKGSRTVSVVLPALDEESMVGEVVASVRPLLGSLAEELAVLDSGPPTGRRRWPARPAPRWSAAPTCSASWNRCPGKGEALWRRRPAT
ncbi:MAG TPA: hypothetical protein VNP92_30655 [Actinophytocola sp.]|nr:hypothetical protein [Actinophytocola sp.]